MSLPAHQMKARHLKYIRSAAVIGAWTHGYAWEIELVQEDGNIRKTGRPKVRAQVAPAGPPLARTLHQVRCPPSGTQNISLRCNSSISLGSGLCIYSGSGD
jgi:hypothetical protein